MVPGEDLEARFKGDIRRWTLAGLKQFDMYRLISELVKPLQLGEPGRQKVQRECWSTPTDALDLVSELKDMAGCYVKYDTDGLHRLKHVFWSTGQQQVFARQWGGIVLQDNTALTNRVLVLIRLIFATGKMSDEHPVRLRFIQPRAFASRSCRYGMHFMLFIGVDSENKTVVFAQGFFSDQSSDTYQWALKHYCTICGGQPEVIITDADAGMTHAVETFLPSTTVHLYCLWHVMKNVRKNCARALGKKASRFYRLLHAAAFAATEEACSDAWSEIFRHVKGSDCEEYVTGHLLRHHRHWSRCFFPTTMTLNMTATQRVEGMFSVLKKGRIVNRRCSLVRVKAELEKRIAGFTLASNLLSTKAPSLGRQHIDDHVLKTAEHVFRQLTDVGASTYAVNEMVAEMRASAAYDTAVLTDKQADDAACHDCLDGLAERGGRTEGYCADVPAEAFEGSHDPDITMYGTTSLPSFAELVRNVGIEAVVQVQYKYPRTARRGKVSHIVVVGPKGFQLCTCLKLMRCGLPCSHVFAALVTRLDRASDFIGASIHPRWRKSVVEWSLRNVALGTFDGHETFTGGFTEDFGGGDFDGDSQDTLNTSVAYTRKKAYVDYIAMAQQWANQAAATLDGTPAAYQAYCAMVERQRHEVQALLRGPGPSDGLAGLGNPPIALPNDRKETRHKDAAGTEGGRPKKKSKVEKVVALIQSGKM
ncbi:unnamed protein product [Ectocarpus sp. CCAP 1310/34]|nr:unnamed protein product [Ectocarpus sp. CCAP 1310/34]